MTENNVIKFRDTGQPVQNEPDGIIACYERLSQEDKNDGESNSIASQKKILEHYCKSHGYTPLHHYDEDDGVDNTKGESEFTAIRNVFNEMYARDTSKKIRASFQSKGKSAFRSHTVQAVLAAEISSVLLISSPAS